MTHGMYDKFTPPTLADLSGRTITYLRVSVTDRCNFVCTYCLPAEGVPGSPRATILSFEETERLVRAFAQLGVRSVRITGGEPTVRRDIVDLVSRVAAVDGIADVAMTTNAFILDRLAVPLKRAGLTRLNVSLDTIVPREFSELTRGEDLSRVIAGLEAARDAGFRDTKINAVVVRDVNDASAPGLVEWCWERGFIPRFIELMPMGEGKRLVEAGRSVPNEEVRRLLGDRIESEAHGRSSGQGPAVYYRGRRSNGSADADGPYMVGFIGAMTENFCADCNRVRITSQGELRPCLASLHGVSLRDVMRAGGTDAALVDLIQQTLHGKKPGHEFVEGSGTNGDIPMVTIGG